MIDQNPAPGDVKSKKAGEPSSSYNRRLIRSQDAFARRLLRSNPPSRWLRSSPSESFSRRLIRSSPSGAFNRRLLRSTDAYARRLLRSDASTSFNRRLLRSDPYDAFKRRIFKKSADAPMEKRQSLIPFPRTGKRASTPVAGRSGDESEPEILFPVYQQMSRFNLHDTQEDPEYVLEDDEDEEHDHEDDIEEEINEGI